MRRVIHFALCFLVYVLRIDMFRVVLEDPYGADGMSDEQTIVPMA